MKRIIISAVALFIIGCEGQSDRDLESIRSCSDTATKLAFSGDTSGSISKATECDSLMVSKSLTSTEAYQIHFGILIIKEGKIAKMADMVQAMKTAGKTGTNSINGALSFLAFSTRSESDRLTTLGEKIGGSAQLLAALIKMATILQELGNLITGDPDSVKNKIAACAAGTCSTEQKTEIASAAIAYQSGACASTKDNESTDPNNNCYKAKQITGGSTDPDTVLTNLNNLANKSS